MTTWVHREPTLESVKDDLDCCDVLEAARRHHQELADWRERWGAYMAVHEPVELELLNKAQANAAMNVAALEAMADRLAPEKLAHDHAEWAELQADEQEQAA